VIVLLGDSRGSETREIQLRKTNETTAFYIP
jgi:hypothetical protein